MKTKPEIPTAETPERARRIGSQFTSESFAEKCPHCGSVLFVERGKCVECGKAANPSPPKRVVFEQWPLKRLQARGIISDIQFAAGWKYYQHWYAAGLSPIGAVDFSRVSGSAEPNVGMPASELQAHHRGLYRLGEQKMGQEFSPYVNAVVLCDTEPESVGLRMTIYRDKAQARAVAIDRLKLGLDRLSEAYSLLPRGRTGGNR